MICQRGRWPSGLRWPCLLLVTESGPSCKMSFSSIIFLLLSLLPSTTPTHLVHVEYEVQLADVFKAFIQRLHKHLRMRKREKKFICHTSQIKFRCCYRTETVIIVLINLLNKWSTDGPYSHFCMAMCWHTLWESLVLHVFYSAVIPIHWCWLAADKYLMSAISGRTLGSNLCGCG